MKRFWNLGKEQRAAKSYSFLFMSLVLLAVLGTSTTGLVAYLNSSPNSVGTVHIDIEPGMGAGRIGVELEERGIIRSSIFFSITARLGKLDRRIRAGSHSIDGSRSTLNILRDLLYGGLITRRITIPEGSSLERIAEILADSIQFSAEDFLTVAKDSAIVEYYAYSGGRSLEGHLFPDTYNFNIGDSPNTVIKVMVERGRELFTEDMKEQAKENQRLLKAL